MSQSQPDEPPTPQTPPHSNSLLPPTTPTTMDNPSPPSSAGSTKRPPQDDISELVRKAKASRYAQPTRKPSDDDIADTFERDLSCAICSEVLANPVACIDCLHNFCGSCLVPWFERSNTCPTCRQPVKSTRDNHNIAGLIDSLLSRFPDKKRDSEELKELELVYKPGQKINITSGYYDDDDQPNPDDGEDEEEEAEESHILWSPCPCCTPGNPLGFTCPDPIPPPDPVTGVLHAADVHSHRNHVHCQTCSNTFPTIWKPDGWKCENCPILYCGNLFPCTRDRVLQLLPNQAASIPAVDLIRIPDFRGNMVEVQKFEQWRISKNLTTPAVAFKIYTWLLRKNNGLFPMAANRMIREQQYVCSGCVAQVIQNNFLNWWCSEKDIEGFIDGRERCWYGRECTTQLRSRDHAERLAHAWEILPPDQRRNTRRRAEAGEDRRNVGRLANAGDGGHGADAVPAVNVAVADGIPAPGNVILVAGNLIPAGDGADVVLADAAPAGVPEHPR